MGLVLVYVPHQTCCDWWLLLEVLWTPTPKRPSEMMQYFCWRRSLKSSREESSFSFSLAVWPWNSSALHPMVPKQSNWSSWRFITPESMIWPRTAKQSSTNVLVVILAGPKTLVPQWILSWWKVRKTNCKVIGFIPSTQQGTSAFHAGEEVAPSLSWVAALDWDSLNEFTPPLNSAVHRYTDPAEDDKIGLNKNKLTTLVHIGISFWKI